MGYDAELHITEMGVQALLIEAWGHIPSPSEVGSSFSLLRTAILWDGERRYTSADFQGSSCAAYLMAAGMAEGEQYTPSRLLRLLTGVEDIVTSILKELVIN